MAISTGDKPASSHAPALNAQDKVVPQHVTKDNMDNFHAAIEDDDGIIPAFVLVAESVTHNVLEATKGSSMEDGTRDRIGQELAHLKSAISKVKEIDLDPTLKAKEDRPKPLTTKK